MNNVIDRLEDYKPKAVYEALKIIIESIEELTEDIKELKNIITKNRPCDY